MIRVLDKKLIDDLFFDMQCTMHVPQSQLNFPDNFNIINRIHSVIHKDHEVEVIDKIKYDYDDLKNIVFMAMEIRITSKTYHNSTTSFFRGGYKISNKQEFYMEDINLKAFIEFDDYVKSVVIDYNY